MGDVRERDSGEAATEVHGRSWTEGGGGAGGGGCGGESGEGRDHHNCITRVLKWVFMLIFSLKGAFFEIIEPKY